MAAVGIESLITEALLQRLAALALTPALPVAYPNVAFTPPVGGSYLEAREPLRSSTEAIGISRWNEHTGIFQIDVVYRAQDGAIAPTEIADKVADWFKRGTRLINGSVRVDINEPPSVAASMADAPYIRIPVSVRYRVFTP